MKFSKFSILGFNVRTEIRSAVKTAQITSIIEINFYYSRIYCGSCGIVKKFLRTKIWYAQHAHTVTYSSTTFNGFTVATTGLWPLAFQHFFSVRDFKRSIVEFKKIICVKFRCGRAMTGSCSTCIQIDCAPSPF